MILTSHRPVHHPTPSASPFRSEPVLFRSSSSHQSYPTTAQDSVSSSSSSRCVLPSEPGTDLKRPLNPTRCAGMASAHSHRKRRATSPTGSTRTFSSTQLFMHRHHSTTSGIVTLNMDPRKDSAVSLHMPSPTQTSKDDPDADHVIELSSIEQCMPRAYIRVCLAYRLPDHEMDEAINRLSAFVRRTIDAKPYLTGFVMPADGSTRTGPVEIRFTNDDYEKYPPMAVDYLYDDDGQLMDYELLDEQGFPPSKLRPEKVSVLPAMIADERRAPVFRAQANIVRGGLVVSLYLHHCISDGSGLGMLSSGSIQRDEYAFKRHLNGQSNDAYSLAKRLAIFANQMTVVRKNLSFSRPNTITNRSLVSRRLGETIASNPPGRGCVITIPFEKVDQLRDNLSEHLPGIQLTRHDVLQALIWRHMVRARIPVVRRRVDLTKSKLLIPVNVRNRMTDKVPKNYFGAAVDFASAEFDIDSFAHNEEADLARAAKVIKDAVAGVDDDYVRQAIALARSENPHVDVRDLLAANIDRVHGADLYITSWERLELYEATLDMGLGPPDWVRKPWSRDPGSCIILPRNKTKAQFEVTIQMTEDDMERLLHDQEFMKYTTRIID